jgi:hypothetical protein
MLTLTTPPPSHDAYINAHVALCMYIQQYKVMTDSWERYYARTLYTEMEMFIPIEHTVEATRKFIAFMETVKDKHDPANVVSFMVRYVAADDILLSPMYGRDTAVLSIIVLGDSLHTGDQDEFVMYSQGLERIAKDYFGGRPHWGKRNYFTSKELAEVYPETYDEYNRVRGVMDPLGIFKNEYLQQRLEYSETEEAVIKVASY